jgi:hypothetical protein
MDLFGNDNGAIFSEDRKYRYALWRIWDKEKPLVMFIGLNPSRANEDTPDNTVTKVGKVSKNNGYGGFYMMNIFSLVSPYPNDLKTCENPVMDNDKYLIEISAICKDVVFCWGGVKEAIDRSEYVKKLFPKALCFKITKYGFPWHPLYCKDKTILIPFKTANT